MDREERYDRIAYPVLALPLSVSNRGSFKDDEKAIKNRLISILQKKTVRFNQRQLRRKIRLRKLERAPNTCVAPIGPSTSGRIAVDQSARTWISSGSVHSSLKAAPTPNAFVVLPIEQLSAFTYFTIIHSPHTQVTFLPSYPINPAEIPIYHHLSTLGSALLRRHLNRTLQIGLNTLSKPAI